MYASVTSVHVAIATHPAALPACGGDPQAVAADRSTSTTRIRWDRCSILITAGPHPRSVRCWPSRAASR